MKININEINGSEIINFLNSLSSDNNPDLEDVSTVLGTFKFESQYVKDDEYCLSFTACYNNWGRYDDITDNQLFITEDDLWLSLEEPFEGDGTDDTLETILKKWLETYEFTDQSEIFEDKLRDVYEMLPGISFNSITEMDKVIKTLTEAKSLMKPL